MLWPSSATITSPTSRPASAAGLSGATSVTTAPAGGADAELVELVARQIADGFGRHAEEGGLRRHFSATLPQLVDQRLDVVDGDGEADVLGVGGDRGVDPDHLTGGVEQRATRVAGVDGGVGLDEARAA